MLSVNALRPWAEFAEKGKFKKPEPQNYADRLRVNLSYYRVNYAVILAVCLLYVCIARPVFILSLPVIGGGGFYLFQIRRTPFLINGRPLTRKATIGGFVAVSVLLMLYAGGFSAAAALCLAALIILAHSTFRERSFKARGATYVDAWRGGGSAPLAGMVDGGKKDDGKNSGDDVEDEENPKKSEQEKNTAQFRAQFREKMKEKYLKKKDDHIS